ncbi:hypothetical protein N9137_00885 [Pseudomonadales bacterium]|nr:hypothetical protein [Pseudomonadales bacterium]
MNSRKRLEFSELKSALVVMIAIIFPSSLIVAILAVDWITVIFFAITLSVEIVYLGLLIEFSENNYE